MRGHLKRCRNLLVWPVSQETLSRNASLRFLSYLPGIGEVRSSSTVNIDIKSQIAPSELTNGGGFGCRGHSFGTLCGSISRHLTAPTQRVLSTETASKASSLRISTFANVIFSQGRHFA